MFKIGDRVTYSTDDGDVSRGVVIQLGFVTRYSADVLVRWDSTGVDCWYNSIGLKLCKPLVESDTTIMDWLETYV